MTKKEMIAKIQETERVLWREFRDAEALANEGRYGDIAKEALKSATTRWASVYRLMEELKIGQVDAL